MTVVDGDPQERIDIMIAIKPFAEIMDTEIGVDVLKKIEWVGRTCYKSTDKITDDSAEKFVSGLISRGHEAMLEHGSFCFMIPHPEWEGMQTIINNLQHHEGFKSFLRFTNDGRCLVSGNVRAWRDFFTACYEQTGCLPNYFEPFIKYYPVLFPEFQKGIKWYGLNRRVTITPVQTKDLKTVDEILTHQDVTVRFVVDRGVTHEIVRHRPASFAQESTRYCNYSKDKFGGELTFIIPEFFAKGSPEFEVWRDSMELTERAYLNMTEMGVTPEKARTVLPNSLKTELIMTANCGEWFHFFELRACNYTGKAHPQMLEVSRPLLDAFKHRISGVFDELTYGA